MLRLGVDIGGTFTDAVILDEENQSVALSKVPSTPSDYSEGVLGSIRRLKDSMSDISTFKHGTTVGTNAIIQGTFHNAALLTTNGFRDILEIARGNRVDMYDPFYRMPVPLIPRDMRVEVSGRISSKGEELESLDLKDTEEKIRSLVQKGTDTIAVCLINSYANSAHEEKIRDIVRRLYPEVLISISTEISREYNEYERTSTVVLNTLLLRIMDRYLALLEREIVKLGFGGKLMLMQSNGGLLTSTLARKMPVYTINSGLVGGILAVSALGEILGIKDLIGADMGGTSFDVELVVEGKYETTPIMKITTPTSGPDGYPILIPAVDIHAIGTGGGSIAWVDSTGSLHVGPKSAAASPGPACYGKGGSDATVTDANLLLGRLNPREFLGGEMKIFPELSEKAMKVIADHFSMDILEAAEGILRIAVPSMASAIRTMTIGRGMDPRDFAMVSFGGAGPLHASLIARELDIKKVIVSTMPGNFSAWGMLMADLRRDYVQTYILNFERLDAEAVERRFSKMEEEALKTMKSEGVRYEETRLVRHLDVRYVGQGHALTIPISGKSFDEGAKSGIQAQFDDLHLKRYLHNAPKQPKELVALRLVAVGLTRRVSLPTIRPGGNAPPSDSRKADRDVYLDGSFQKCKIYDRSRLFANNVIEGPSIIEESVSTTLLLEGQKAEVDSYGHLIVSWESK